ncbi:hypothetical protein KSP40_PGU002183 [Platanthera guangdongensis]|uniref:Uncharacterized protein n=1 Tax=Platanthera guangdongensis TaxID=2320717 RepID=A0ABR2LG18_9ASPA
MGSLLCSSQARGLSGRQSRTARKPGLSSKDTDFLSMTGMLRFKKDSRMNFKDYHPKIDACCCRWSTAGQRRRAREILSRHARIGKKSPGMLGLGRSRPARLLCFSMHFDVHIAKLNYNYILDAQSFLMCQ